MHPHDEEGTVTRRMRLGERQARSGFVGLACAVYAACAVWATWPAFRHIGERYLARPAPGAGEAAAGDHLQLAWAFWLPGHQLARGAAPWADPYSFQPEADAAPNLQGWLLGAPYWVLRSPPRARVGLRPHRAARLRRGGWMSSAGGCGRSRSGVRPPSSAASPSRSLHTGSASPRGTSWA